MNVFAKSSPEWPLRLGLGAMYLYSGIDLVLHPTAWAWAIPYWLRQTVISVVPLNTYLQLQGAVEIVFALALLAWFLPRGLVRGAALLSALEFLVILALAFFPFSEAIFLITFRDIGLLGASIALFMILREEQYAGIRPS